MIRLAHIVDTDAAELIAQDGHRQVKTHQEWQVEKYRLLQWQLLAVEFGV